jgi:hypothetical protein
MWVTFSPLIAGSILTFLLAIPARAETSADDIPTTPTVGSPPVASEAPLDAAPTPTGEVPPDSVAGTEFGEAGDILPEDCEGTNRSLLTTAAVVDVVSLIFFFLMFALANRRDWIKPGGAVRYFVVLLPFLVIPAVGLSVLRPDVEIVALCVARADYRHLLVLVDQPTWLQCAALGSAPVLLVALLFPFVSAPLRRRK